MYNKKLAFAAACIDIFVFGIGIISLGSILPYLTETFDLDDIAKGTLASLLPLGILTGSLVFGPVVDKYSYKNLLNLSIFLNILGLELIAWANSFFFLGLAFFLIGWGGGMINGATSALVSDISEDHGENKGANLSLFGVFFGVGALGMPVIIGFLSDSYETNQIIAGIGFFLVLPLIFNLSIKFPDPKQAQAIAFRQFFSLAKNRLLLLFGFVMFFQSGLEALANNWTTSYLIEIIEVGEKVRFIFRIQVSNNSATETISNIVVKDKLGADLDLWLVGSGYGYYHIQHGGGSVTLTTNRNGDQHRLTWQGFSLGPGSNALLYVFVETDLDHGGNQRYTEAGIHYLNSGATVKGIFEGHKVSSSSDALWVEVFEPN